MPSGGILRHRSRGEVGHQKEEKGISGHMQIEVDQAVYKNSAAPNKGRQTKNDWRPFRTECLAEYGNLIWATDGHG